MNNNTGNGEYFEIRLDNKKMEEDVAKVQKQFNDILNSASTSGLAIDSAYKNAALRAAVYMDGTKEKYRQGLLELKKSIKEISAEYNSVKQVVVSLPQGGARDHLQQEMDSIQVSLQDERKAFLILSAEYEKFGKSVSSLELHIRSVREEMNQLNDTGQSSCERYKTLQGELNRLSIAYGDVKVNQDKITDKKVNIEITADTSKINSKLKEASTLPSLDDNIIVKTATVYEDAYKEAAKRASEYIDGTKESAKRGINDMKAAIKDMEGDYNRTQKELDKKQSPAKSARLENKLKETSLDIDKEKASLSILNGEYEKVKSTVISLESQQRSLREEMGKLRGLGQVDTEQYRQLQAELQTVGTEYRTVLAEQKALSTGGSHFEGIISGLQGLSGAVSAAMGVTGLFVKKHDDLEKIQTKLQSVMAISVGLMNVQQTLHQTSAFRITTVTKVTGLWTLANSFLSKSFVGLGMGIKTANIAAKAFAVTITLGISVAITGLMYLINKYIDKQEEQRKATEEAAQKIKECNDGISESASGSIAKIEKLTYSWSKLSSEAEKTQFIKDNQKAFNDLGFSINSVNDANNLLIKNKDLVIEVFVAQATAAAAMNMVMEKAKENVGNRLEMNDMSTEIKEQQKMVEELEAVKAKAVKDNKDNNKGYALGHATMSLAKAESSLNDMITKWTLKRHEIAENEKEIGKILDQVSKANDKANAGMKKAGMQTPEELTSINRQEQEKQIASDKATALAEKASKDEIERKKRVAETIRKAMQDLSNEAYNIELSSQDRQISLMEDGAAKRLAINQLNYKKELRALEEWEQKQVDMYNELAKAKAIESAGNKGGPAAKKAESDYLPVNTFDEMVAQNSGTGVIPIILSQVIADESVERANDIKSKLTAANSETLEEYKKSWEEWSSESERIDNEIASAKEKAATDYMNVAKMLESGAMPMVDAAKATESIKRGSEEQISVLESTKAQLSDTWINLFTDLDAMTNKGIRDLIVKINDEINNMPPDTPATDKAALLERLNQLQNKLTSSSPWAALANGVKTWGDAITEADKKAANVATGKAVVACVSEAQDGLNAVTGMLEALGVEIPPIVDGISGALGAIASIDFSNPFSIVIGGIKAITSIISGIFNQSEARIQQQMEATQKAIALSGKQIDKLQKAVDNNSYGVDKAAEILKMGDEYAKQLNAIKEAQAEVEQGKNTKKNRERTDELNNQYEEIQEKQEETKQQALDAIFGTDLKSAIEDFSSSYMDAWSSGELNADFGKRMVDNMIKQAVQQMLSAKVAEKMAILQKMIADAVADGVMTEDEYSAITDYANGIKNDLDTVTDGFEMAKDAQGKLNEVTGKGFDGITQETGGKLDGKFTLMLENQMAMRGEMADFKVGFTKHMSDVISNLDAIKKNTEKLHSIDDNTKAIMKTLSSVVVGIKSVRVKEIE